MSRIRFFTNTTAVAGLWVSSFFGTEAKAQVIDLQIPALGGVRMGADPFRGAQFGPGNDWSRSAFPTSTHRHPSGFPGHAGPIGGPGLGGGFGHHAPGGFGHHAPGGFGHHAPGGGFGHHAPGGGFPIDRGFGGPGFGGGFSPAIGAVDQLIGEVGAFLQNFGPTVHVVPQGNRMYRDALDLYESASAFRQAALSGASPHELRRLQGRIDSSSRRLVSRVNSVSRGRTGPNIEHVRYIGELARQVRFLI
jgi:hypothetical protein